MDNSIVSICGDGVGIVGVWSESVDFGDKVLVEEELSDVSDATTCVCAVGENRTVKMCLNVYMGCSSRVVTGEDTLILDDTIRVSGLQSTEKGLVDVRFVGGIAIASRYHTGIDTSGIAVPNIGGEIFDGLAGIDVDELEVPCDGDTGLGLSDVAADILSLDV